MNTSPYRTKVEQACAVELRPQILWSGKTSENGLIRIVQIANDDLICELSREKDAMGQPIWRQFSGANCTIYAMDSTTTREKIEEINDILHTIMSAIAASVR